MTGNEPRRLPPGLDLLWGRRERGKRGPRPELSADAIVAAAVRIADAEGLDAVSMARVAHELGFTTMSLYRHVTSKEELLQLMWDDSARDIELILEGDGWRPKLRTWAVAQRETIDRHPWITQMPMAAPPLGPNSLRFAERGLEALDGTSLTDPDKLRVLGLLSTYALSEARMAHDAARAATQARATPEGTGATSQADRGWTFETLLRELVDDTTFPRLHRIAWSAGTGGAVAPPGERAEFLFGVDRILDGVQALIEQCSENFTRTHRVRASARHH